MDNPLKELVVIFGIIFAFLFSIISIVNICDYITASNRSDTYTRICGTEVTTGDIFWNDDEILLSLIGCAPDLRKLEVDLNNNK